MSTAQTIELYKVLNRYFKNEEDATVIVRDIERIIDNKFEDKKEMLASKHDIMALKDDIMRLENKLNDHLKWVMGAIIGMGGLIIAAFKLL